MANTQFSPGEKQLLRVFEAYLKELFDHGDAHAGASLMELVTLHAFDDVHAAGLLAENEFGHEAAAEMCRRVGNLRHMGLELTRFLEAKGPSEVQELPTVQSMKHRAELEAKFGGILDADRRIGELSRELPKDESDDYKRNPWSILRDLESIVWEARNYVDLMMINALDSDSDCLDSAATRKLINDQYLSAVGDFQAVKNYLEEMHGWLRENGVESEETLRGREIIARGRQIREDQGQKSAISIALEPSQQRHPSTPPPAVPS